MAQPYGFAVRRGGLAAALALLVTVLAAAAAHAATGPYTWSSSIARDACKAPGTACVNGIIPTSAAFPLHPNQLGEQNMANQVLAHLS